MGLWSFLTSGKKMEEIKMALVGKYVFDDLKDDKLKDEIVELANNRLKEGYASQGFQHEHTLDEHDAGGRYLFFALAMMELGVDHGVKNFQWTYVRNPLMIRHYDAKLWEIMQEVLEKKNDIKVSLCLCLQQI